MTPGGNLNSATGWAVMRSVNSSGVYQPAVDSSQGVHPASSGSTGAARIYQGTVGGSEPDIVDINANYEIVDGFEIDGVSASGQGVCLNDTRGYHHAIGENNLVHDCGGGGFQWNNSEYMWIYNNVVHDNSQTSGYAESGISVYEPAVASSFTHTAYDTALPFHIMTVQNLIWHNYMNSSVAAGSHTDGEGIIYDTWASQTTPYTTPGLIYGNVICYNGGGGIQTDNSAYITIANNSTYSDYLDLLNSATWRGEGAIYYINSTNNTLINNIFMNVTSGTGINAGDGGTGSLSNNQALIFEDSGAGNVATTNDNYPSPLFYGNGATAPTETGNVNITPAYTAVGTLPSSSTNTIPCNLRPTSGSLPAATAASYIPSGVTKIGAYGPGALH
jgi:hypothetical protein